MAIYRQTPDLVQAAILFNLALLHHLECADSGRSCYAKEADLFYEAANDAINIAIDQGACTQCEASLILLAIWNNRAHIASLSIIDLSSADVLIKKMKDVMQNHTTLGFSISMDDFRIFFLNMFVLNECNGKFAPASAA
jgi:hypothetical protein